METMIEERILHVLGIYPIISPTMMQAGLGPQIKPADWRPVYDQLIEDGKIELTTMNRQTPYGRSNAYTLVHMPGVKVEFPKNEG